MSTIIFAVVAVFAFNAHAGVGKLVSVKSCTRNNNCKNLKMPKEKSCAVSVTSMPKGDDSDFRGIYSMPALSVSDKGFTSSIYEYSSGNFAAGVVRGTFSSQQIGEWNGRFGYSKSGSLTVAIKNFYVYIYGAGDSYTEYTCKL